MRRISASLFPLAVAAFVAPSPPAMSSEFPRSDPALPADVSRDHWASRSISQLMVQDLVSLPEDGRFRGEATLNLPDLRDSLVRLLRLADVPRASAAQCLGLDRRLERYAEKGVDRYLLTFLTLRTLDCLRSQEIDLAMPNKEKRRYPDVPKGHFAYESVYRLVTEYSLVGGYPDGAFRGERSVSRYEFAAFLERLLGRILFEPYGIAVDGGGSLFVSDFENGRIYKIEPSGRLGAIPLHTGASDSANRSVTLYSPLGLATDASSVLYVAEHANHRVVTVDPAGKVASLAGKSGVWGHDDGARAASSLWFPWGIATDASGSVYVSEYGGYLRRITPDGIVRTLAGGAPLGDPAGLAVDRPGQVVVADRGGHCIRLVGTGTASILAGDGTPGFADGVGSSARFNRPEGVALDTGGTLYVADRDNNRVRTVTRSGVVSTLAGDGVAGLADGPGATARFNQPHGLAVARDGTVYVADGLNRRIRMISSSGAVSTLAVTRASSPPATRRP